MARARAALVTIGVGDEADPVAVAEGVLEEPLEAAPVGVDLDHGLEPRIVEADDVRVAPTDVGDEHHVVAAPELIEQRGHGEAVGGGIGHVVHLGVRGAVERREVAPVHHVSIAAARRHARPLVADEDDAAAVSVEAVDLAAEPLPFLLRHLEVIGLVTHHVEERDVPPEGEVFLDRARAHRRARLPVQIPPEGLGLSGQDRADQIGARDVIAPVRRDARFGARGGEREAREPGRGDLAALPCHTRGKTRDRGPLRAEPDLAREPLAWVAPDVLGLDERVERLARAHGGRRRRRRAGGAGRRPPRRSRVRARAPSTARYRRGRRRAGTHSRARGTSGLATRARRAAVADRDVDAVAGIERAVRDRDDGGT